MERESPVTPSTAEYPADGICRVLSLDGGGAKGFYTLGVLQEIEALTKKRLHACFDLIYGTSTGAIIAALLVTRLSPRNPLSSILYPHFSSLTCQLMKSFAQLLGDRAGFAGADRAGVALDDASCDAGSDL